MGRFALLLLILGLVLAGTAWWAAGQAGHLPGWYLQARAAGELEPDLSAAAGRARQSLIGRFGRELIDEVTADDGTPDESFLERVKRRGKLVLEGLREGREVRLEAADLEGLMLAMADEHERGRELLAATRAVRAEITGDGLELGAVVVPARLPADHLSRDQRRLLDLLQRLAGADGELFVAVRGAPRVVDERLRLGPPVDLRLGAVPLDSRLLQVLGIEASELGSGLVLDVGRMKVRRAATEAETLVLVVSPDI